MTGKHPVVDAIVAAMKREEGFLEEIFNDEEIRAVAYAMLYALETSVSDDQLRAGVAAWQGSQHGDGLGDWRCFFQAAVRQACATKVSP